MEVTPRTRINDFLIVDTKEVKVVGASSIGDFIFVEEENEKIVRSDSQISASCYLNNKVIIKY